MGCEKVWDQEKGRGSGVNNYEKGMAVKRASGLREITK